MAIFTYPPNQVTIPGAATETTLQQVEANTSATATELANKLAGALVTSAFDYIALTYVPSGPGVGEVQTAVYKSGGALGTTVATLTLAYDGSNRLSSVTKA